MKKIVLVILAGILAFTIGFSQQKPLADSLSSIGTQYYTLENNETIKREPIIPESVKIILIYSSSIILNAMGDSFKDSGKNKVLGHFCNAASIGLLVTSPFIIDYDKSKWGWYLTSFVALRIALFDYTYNATRGLPLNYIGGTSTWDKVMGKLKPPDTYLGRSVFFIVGVSVPINEIGKKHHKKH